MTQGQAVSIRRNAVVILEHAIARIGAWDAEGWLTDKCDRDAVYLLQHAQWGLEAMDSPASNRFWDEQRREYDAMIAELGVQL